MVFPGKGIQTQPNQIGNLEIRALLVTELRLCGSSQTKPLILLLSPGTDPLSAIRAFRAPLDIAPTSTVTLSLGQGQVNE